MKLKGYKAAVFPHCNFFIYVSLCRFIYTLRKENKLGSKDCELDL